MLTKQAVICQCRLLDFPTDQYCVAFGAAMVMHGIIQETKDIDLYATPELFDSLTQKYELKCGHFDEPYICINNRIDIFKTNRFLNPPHMVSGVPVLAPEDIIYAKRKLGREKDLEDIAMIEAFISKQEAKK